MGSAELSDFIKEAIEDEQRIVTYKWISITKNISMNEAKTALENFVASGACPGLTVYLCVIGYRNCGSQKTLALKIVKSNEKEATLKAYNEATIHVYGIQRANTEAPLLYSCDYDINKKFSLSSKGLLAIRHDGVTVRPCKKSTEQIPLQTNSADVQRKVTPSIINKKSGMSSFFSKQKESQLKTIPDNADSGLNDVKSSSEARESQESDKSYSKETSRKSNAKTNSKPAAKCKPTSDKPLLVEKGKRKRAIVESSSEAESTADEECNISQDLFDSSPSTHDNHLGSNSNSDPMVPKSHIKTEELDHVETKENQSLNCGVSMRKISTVKMYIDDDEDGFMITERVEETVKVPINEGKETNVINPASKSVNPKPEAAKKVQTSKKKSAPVSAKQSTISSFFTKK